MDKATAKELVKLSEASRAETWFRRDPPPNNSFGLTPIIQMPREGTYGQEVLAEDYEGDDEMRENHIGFVALSARHIAELAKFWLEMHEEPK